MKDGSLDTSRGNFSTSGAAVIENHSGEVNISGGTFTNANKETTHGCIVNRGDGIVNITGGHIVNEDASTVLLAIYGGKANISGGLLESVSNNVIRVYGFDFTETNNFGLTITGTSTELRSTGGPTLSIDENTSGTVTIGTLGSSNTIHPYLSNGINNKSSNVTVRIYSGNQK